MAVVQMLRPTAEQVDLWLGRLRELLLAETVREVTVEDANGMDSRDNYETQHIERERNGTYTITYRINGGARDRTLDPVFPESGSSVSVDMEG